MYFAVFIRCASAVTRFHSLLFVVTCCHSLYHSLSHFITRCTTRCHSLLLLVICYHSLSFIITYCHLLPLIVPIVAIRCHSFYQSLSLVVICCCRDPTWICTNLRWIQLGPSHNPFQRIQEYLLIQQQGESQRRKSTIAIASQLTNLHLSNLVVKDV